MSFALLKKKKKEFQKFEVAFRQLSTVLDAPENDESELPDSFWETQCSVGRFTSKAGSNNSLSRDEPHVAC